MVKCVSGILRVVPWVDAEDEVVSAGVGDCIGQEDGPAEIGHVCVEEGWSLELRRVEWLETGGGGCRMCCLCS